MTGTFRAYTGTRFAFKVAGGQDLDIARIRVESLTLDPPARVVVSASGRKKGESLIFVEYRAGYSCW